MIRKLLNKIKNMFSKKEDIVKNNCPYKVEPVYSVEEIHPVKQALICEHCNEELKGKESEKDEDGAMYIWCRNCNYVNKVKDGKIIKKENVASEVLKAFKLFEKAGLTANSYSYTEDGEKHNL